MASKAFDILDDATSYIDQQERQTGIKFIRRSTSPGFATGGKLLCEPPKFGCVLSVIGYDPEIFRGPFSSICYVPVFLGRSFVNRLCPWIGDSVTYFIHRIAIHDATKLSGMLFNAINARNAINTRKPHRRSCWRRHCHLVHSRRCFEPQSPQKPRCSRAELVLS